MIDQPDRILFPLAKAAAAVTAVVAFAGVAAWGLVGMWFPQEPVTPALLSMMAVVWLTTLATLLPFRVVDSRVAANSLLSMYMAGSVLRMLFCLGGVAVAAILGDLPAGPLAVSLLLLYGPAMVAEIAFVRGYLRKIFTKPQPPLESSEALA